MKKIILTAAALALTATAASAGSAIPLNSNGERKHDYASRLQAERGEGQVEFGSRGGLDMTATQSISSAPVASGRVSIRRIDDRNEGTIVEYSRINEQGKREVFRTVHFPS